MEHALNAPFFNHLKQEIVCCCSDHR